MLRLLMLSLPAAMILVGFAVPFIIPGGIGYLLAAALISIGSVALWFIEVKTVKSLEKRGALNEILNTKDGPD